MAVTITASQLAARLRTGTTAEELAEVQYLLDYASVAVLKYAPDAPDVAQNEGVRLLAGYLFDAPTQSSGDRYANAMRNSGAARSLLPYRIHRAGDVAGAIADADAALGTGTNPVTFLAIVAGDLIVTFADGTTEHLTLPEGMGGGGGGGGLPTPDNDADTSLRWDGAAWEAFSPVSTWYYALTLDNSLPQIPEALLEALTSGFSPTILGASRTTYASVAEVVIGRWNLPSYQINGDYAWENRANEAAVFARFNVDDVYSWILLPVDQGGEVALTRFWAVEPIRTSPVGFSDLIPAGTLASGGTYAPVQVGGVNRVLVIDGTEYWALRAALHWEAGTVNHNFAVRHTPSEDAPTAVWQ